MSFIGIDPGVAGGMAVITNRGYIERVTKMPSTDKEVWKFLNVFRGRSRVVLEHVHASPQMGVVSAFTFGCGYGGLRMALTALDMPFMEVRPQEWLKYMNVPKSKGKLITGGFKGPRDKNVTKRMAERLFPGVPVTLAVADALLLAEYCRRVSNE